jgi:hypothetical protein
VGKKIVVALSGAAAVAIAAAAVLLWYAQHYPAAVTPSGIVVNAILQNGGSWSGVGANGAGAFEVLPGAVPSEGFDLYFYAPSPTSLLVDVDGTELPNFTSLAAGADTSGTGYFRIENVNVNAAGAVWRVRVMPPQAKIASPMFTIHIADVSVDPFLTGTARQSTPLAINLVAQKSFVLSVVLSGNGQGSVSSSNPMGIACPSMCVHDFGQSFTVTLTPNPASGSTFDGWAGSCTGYGNCVLTLNGTSFMAIAKFRTTSLSGNPMLSNCPAPNPPEGHTWFSQPRCSLQNVFNDPSPDLGCNLQKYYCCAKSTGAIGACPPDHVEFPATCDFGNPHVLATPTGCYLHN